MTDTPDTPQSDPQNAGISARTDVGGERGTEGALQNDNIPLVDPREAAQQQTQTTTTGTATQTEGDKPNPGSTLGDAAPKLTELQNQLCPNCHTGVLYVTRYDPEALHEQGQGDALAKGKESGGGYAVRCFHCEFTDSRAFNPGTRWGR